jgi:hypothetical protein
LTIHSHTFFFFQQMDLLH